MLKKILTGLSVAASFALIGCEADENYPGTEFAPQMYHSVPYEPLSILTKDEADDGLFGFYYSDKANQLPFNGYADGEVHINQLTPVDGTVRRQEYRYGSGAAGVKMLTIRDQDTTVANSPYLGYDRQGFRSPDVLAYRQGMQQDPDGDGADVTLMPMDSMFRKELMIYNTIAPSDFATAAKLQNPIPATPAILEEGEHLYLGFCKPCHGEAGDGGGKVGEVYGGVPSYKAGRVAMLSAGEIFHTITHGKGLMWPHKTQIDPEDRWKIVHYVEVLQGKSK